MADQETHSSRAEQRMLAVAKLKRAASLPRMKDGRRPPMHVEAVSEGEKAQSEEEKLERDETENATPEVNGNHQQETTQTEEEEKSPEPDSDNLALATSKSTDAELEADTEFDEGPLSSATAFKKRRSRSRSRSRGSKDFKGKFKAPQSPVPQLGGDSSPDENPTAPSPVVLPMVPPLLSPIPHLPFLQQSRFLRSPTPGAHEMSLFYPGTSPPTPLPTLEDLSKNLIRSNSAGSSAAAGRRAAMHKLTGGTETYDPSPSPTPPPNLSKLSRNNTVSGGERFAARQNLLNRLGTRIKEADADAASGGEERGAPSPTPAKRRRRRSRRSSATAAASPNPPTVSDSSNPNTPAVPSTPLPTLLNHFAELRAQSTTPNQFSSSRTQSTERVSDDTPPPPPPLPVTNVEVGEESERPELMRRRSILIEDPDEEDRDVVEHTYVPSPGSPQRPFQNFDIPRSQPSPSNVIPEPVVTGPIQMNQRAPSRNGLFSNSPFQAPIKEKAISDEDEEQVIYPATTARPRTPYGNAIENYEREISWVASPVPEIRMPIDDDEDEDDLEQEVDVRVEHDDEDIVSGVSSHGFSPEVNDDMSRASSSSKSVLVESEMSPEPEIPYAQASPSTVDPALQSITNDVPPSPQTSHTRLSAASRNQSIGDRSPLATDFSEWEGYNDSPKRSEPSTSTTWRQKVKETFSRAGSSSGRRSRTNSIVTRERRDNTDSSISRESGASLMSSKTDKGDTPGTPAQIQAPSLMQSPSASASILSLAPHAPPRSSTSPIPPASSADMSKYRDAKLFPFPGMLRLEQEKQERLLKEQPSIPALGSENALQSNGHDEIQAPAMIQSYSNGSLRSPDVLRDPTFDARFSEKHEAETVFAGPSTSSHQGYIDVSPPQQNGSGYNLKLPTTLPGVKQWLSKNSKKKAVSPPGTAAGTTTFAPLPSLDSQATSPTNKKPSISDIFSKKTGDIAEWEEMANASQPTSNLETLLEQKSPSASTNGNGPNGLTPQDLNGFEKGLMAKAGHLSPLDLTAGRGSPYRFPNDPSSLTRFTTPSISDYPAATASESSSTTSSRYSLGIQQGNALLERLEESLARGSRSPILASAIEEPPRKLILSWPVLQVVNPNTVKDRFLFLFNDILVIAKPVTYDQDNLMDNHKMSLPDRKYTVKSVVQLRNLRFCADRSEAQGKTTSSLGTRSPLIRSFISQFSRDPDHAISTLFAKSDVQDDPVLLGQLLSRILELDRSRLGEYLSRKTSKAVLKSYLDSFGFAGLRVDVALRVFLHSVNVSRHSHSYGALEHLLDSFASRWYEANAKFVAYDKDMAVRLVWALTQLNDRLHGGIAEEPGPTDHIRRTVTSKEFLDAFRRYDARNLVSDDVLQELYRSIYHERLCQASPSSYGDSQGTPITIKRALPTRLTYKMQSEPVIFRLPQADPLLTIELYGQDLEFDPPFLQFSKSPEASFRVTGKSLGSKTITLCRSGPNATKYTGLPFSHTVVVERAFMRNTFQLAFQQSGLKRRYMFSVDDPIIRNEWVTSLKRHIEAANSSAPGPSGLLSSSALKFQKAADAIAFKVLQDTLMGTNGSAPGSRMAGSSAQNSNGVSHLAGSSVSFTSPLHIRSKSRSRVYHRGAGKNEPDLQHSTNESYDSNDYSPDSSDKATEQRLDGVVWTSRDLEIHCQQNSAISPVLSHLRTASQDGPLA